MLPSSPSLWWKIKGTKARKFHLLCPKWRKGGSAVISGCHFWARKGPSSVCMFLSFAHFWVCYCSIVCILTKKFCLLATSLEVYLLNRRQRDFRKWGALFSVNWLQMLARTSFTYLHIFGRKSAWAKIAFSEAWWTGLEINFFVREPAGD